VFGDYRDRDRRKEGTAEREFKAGKTGPLNEETAGAP
jgi:hypothetical protein